MSEPPRNDGFRRIYSVAELNREVKQLLEASYPEIWVEGEVSNLASPASGHRYFSLKDENAQLRCALFRSRRSPASTALANGMHVLARGRMTLYELRGDYQFIVEYCEEAGEGALRRAFEALKQRLAAEGLFAEERKQALPTLPKRVGVVTSASGAALRDIVSTFKRRCPALPLLVYPTPVQGQAAAAAIAAAIGLAAQRAECDALILARGGGSLEDLWPFNEESVARAMARCPIPIVTGVGHETDVTIADFAADRRAPTPTAAAELLSPDTARLLDNTEAHRRRLIRLIGDRFNAAAQGLDWLAKRLVHPHRRLKEYEQRLDDRSRQLSLLTRHLLDQARYAHDAAHARLQTGSPATQIGRFDARRRHLADELLHGVRDRVRHYAARHQVLDARLATLNPRATLARGYAIVRTLPDERVLRDAGSVATGDRIRADLASGRLQCTIDEVVDA